MAAKLSVDVMASQHWPTGWGLPESVMLTALALETEQAVDDLETATSPGGTSTCRPSAASGPRRSRPRR